MAGWSRAADGVSMNEGTGTGRNALVRDAVIVGLLIVAGAVCVGFGDQANAGMLFAAALGAFATMRAAGGGAGARALPLVAGVGASVALGGCTEAETGIASLMLTGAAIGAIVGAAVSSAIRGLGRRRRRSELLSALGLVGVLAVVSSGCAAGQAAAVAGVVRTVGVVTCGVAHRLADACDAAGLSPERSCPLTIEIEMGSGGEVPAAPAPVAPVPAAPPAEPAADVAEHPAQAAARPRWRTVDPWSAKRLTRAEWSARRRGLG